MKYLFYIMIILTAAVNASECDKYQKKIDDLMEEFEQTKDEMSKPGITRNEYDDLYSMYMMLWEDVVQAQKDQKECLESQTKTVRVVVEPRRIDSPLPRLLNIRWRSDRIAVRESLRGRDEIRLKNADEFVLQYEGGKYQSYDVGTWQFSFIDGKLYAVQIMLNNPAGMNSYRLYERISSDLKKTYGDPSYQRNQFPAGYNDDAIRLRAIKNKTVSVYNRWLFRNDDSVRIGFHEDGSVLVTFIVDELFKKAN